MNVPGAPKLVWNIAAELGEGPVWTRGALWFVDIKKQSVHRYEPEQDEKRSWSAPEQIGFLLPVRSGGFVAGLQSGLFHFDEADGQFKLLREVEPDLPGNRINDGVVDPTGRLWFGTMDNAEKSATGRFYRFHGGRLADAGLPLIPITNGPALSPDGRILYHADTLGGLIQACDVAEDGELGPSRPFVQIAPEDGFPDGPTVDAEGGVWIGLYRGWEARRYSRAGELTHRIRFPTSNITKVAFAGDDFRTLYATTARQGLGRRDLEREPLAGGLFAASVDVPGLPAASLIF